MIGKLLSKTIRIATLPLDAASAAMDIISDGGDGSKSSRRDSPIGDLEILRDRIAESAESIDE